MEYTLETQKYYTEEYEKIIQYHIDNRNVIHPYSFMVKVDGIIHIINDYSEKDFNKRLTACLRGESFPFSLFYKKKHLAPQAHVTFLHEYSSRMNRRGRRPALHLTPRDTTNKFER